MYNIKGFLCCLILISILFIIHYTWKLNLNELISVNLSIDNFLKYIMGIIILININN